MARHLKTLAEAARQAGDTAEENQCVADIVELKLRSDSKTRWWALGITARSSRPCRT